MVAPSDQLKRGWDLEVSLLLHLKCGTPKTACSKVPAKVGDGAIVIKTLYGSPLGPEASAGKWLYMVKWLYTYEGEIVLYGEMTLYGEMALYLIHHNHTCIC